ncbi:inositol monophosphatase family protein [Streptomyces zingiberis]|uniref:inositol-phosphate phosphatase n=1 Tax=Streptomyces zingiberis TaxID=2053010 RepID=A0ABX1C2B5_9ACTN|nr:inositol monophosphatase [Streptomyces zingiberis]NJQ02825.1 inositol monophosphatase [Streptomyces zingiberis]
MIDNLSAEEWTKLLAAAEEAVREAAAAEVMPRFRQLGEHEIDVKTGPHDLVTVADRLAEERLTAALPALLPGSVVVGEEAVSADPGVLAALEGTAPVWIVDPVDGTRQFVRGDPGFSTLVTLAHRGESLASWTYAPASDRMAVAVRGGGARLDGRPLRCGPAVPGEPLEIATSHPDFTSLEEDRAFARLVVDGVVPRPCGSAGLEYLHVAQGRLGAVAFGWENPWDHAAGLLLVAEAGGFDATVSGEPFRLAGGNALPFTAARDERTARRVLELMRGSDLPFREDQGGR